MTTSIDRHVDEGAKARAERAAREAGIAERKQQLDFFRNYLRHSVGRGGRPFHEKTIKCYCDVRPFDSFLEGLNFPGGYDQVDVATLNAYFRDYFDRNQHQGGVNTRQRNMAPLFNFVAEEYDVPNPYKQKGFNRYRPGTPKTPIITDDEINALIDETKQAKDFEHVRDHAIIRLFLTGMRLEQMAMLEVEDIDLSAKIAWVRGQKGHDPNQKYPMPFGGKTALALQRWLRLRPENKLVPSTTAGPLWYGTKNRSRLTPNGIYQMLKRRAARAGLDPTKIHPHMFRHTKAHLHLESGGSEGDLMALMQWSSREMTARYGKSEAQARAVKDAHKRGLDDRY